MIPSALESLAPSAPLELFEIDLTPWGGAVLRFHAGTNQLGQPVVWAGETYQPMPIQAEGFEFKSGQAPTPKLRIANINGAITGFILDYEEILGAKVSRIRTSAQYLDAVNFPDGNPHADPEAQLPTEIWYIDRRATETKVFVEFELSSSFDVLGDQLPGRQIIANICPATYRDPDTGCGWSPDPVSGPFFDRLDAPTTAVNDQCSRRLSGCRCRFGQVAQIDFMGFPAAGLIR